MKVRAELLRKLSIKELILLYCGIGEDSWEFLELQGDQTSPSQRKSVLNIHWRYWCWNWNSNTLATWCKQLTHWKITWCWERLKAGGDGDDRRGRDKRVEWHYWFNGHEFEQALRVGDGQGSLACCTPWGGKELDTAEWLSWTELIKIYPNRCPIIILGIISKFSEFIYIVLWKKLQIWFFVKNGQRTITEYAIIIHLNI